MNSAETGKKCQTGKATILPQHLHVLWIFKEYLVGLARQQARAPRDQAQDPEPSCPGPEGRASTFPADGALPDASCLVLSRLASRAASLQPVAAFFRRQTISAVAPGPRAAVLRARPA